MNYPKIYRIPVPAFPLTRGKHYLSEEETKQLLNGLIVMEEKIDGKIDALILEGKTVFFEFMKFKHTIHYTKLPSFKMAFDVWDGARFMGLQEKTIFLFQKHGIPVIRTIFVGRTNYADLLNYLPKILSLKSAYGEEPIEGVIIKNYEKQTFGKIVNPKFEEEIDAGEVHWSKKPKVLNRISH